MSDLITQNMAANLDPMEAPAIGTQDQANDLFQLMEKRPTGAGPGEPPPEERGEDYVSPEEQKQYDQFVTKALKFVHAPETAGNVMAMLNDPSRSVAESVGRATAQIARMVKEQARASGVDLKPDVMFHGAVEVVENLMEVGAAAKIFPMKESSEEYGKTMELAFLEAIKAYGEGLLQDPQAGPKAQAQAETHWLRKVAEENSQGANTPVARGVKQALGER